jgi:hypothetical protein
MSQFGPDHHRKPVKLTDEMREEVCKLLSDAGSTLDCAAEFVGVTRQSFSSWVKRGRAELDRVQEGMEPDEHEAHYAKLALEVNHARAKAEVIALAKLRTAPGNEWVRHAWWLERARGYVRTERRIESIDLDSNGPEPQDIWGTESPLEIARRAEAAWPQASTN